MIEDDFLFPTVGYDSSHEGIFLHQRQLYAFCLKEKQAANLDPNVLEDMQQTFASPNTILSLSLSLYIN